MSFKTQLHSTIDHVFVKLLAKPKVDFFVRSGSYLLRLCFSSERLAKEFLTSFIIDLPGAPDLQIGFLTAADVDLSHLIPDSPGEYRVTASNDSFAVWQPGELPMLYLLDKISNRSLIWLAGNAAPDWVASRPALPIMYAFSMGTPWITVHAAAVGRQGVTLLLVGEGRVGKTTAAVACARAGWDYAGDDYVYTNTIDARVEPLYCSARLRADMGPAFVDMLTSHAQISSSDGEPRYELRLGEQLPADRMRGGTTAAILLPRRRGALRPEFEAARRFDAVEAMYTSMTLVQLGWRTMMLEKVTSFVGLAPIFFVDTGQDPAAIPDAFAQFLDRL